MHGIFFGRVAPPSRLRRLIEAPALVIGHPGDPIHLAADAEMLAEELPRGRFLAASSILEWRLRPERLDAEAVRFAREAWQERPARRGARVGARRERPAERFRGGQNGAVPYYRDEAIVLRTQKLGEADRIITLLTRSHGRVRAVAKGVRRTTSRFGSRLEPFSHVDVQLAEGRSLDVVTQAETLRRLRRRHGS